MALVTAIDRTKIIDAFPFEVREIENIFIPLSDGTKLAARIWLPVNAENKPVPAILEYLPYRKRDGTAARDELTHPYLAGHGYACVRVDIRGYGESQGAIQEEYDPQEQADALEVIQWLTQQTWCDGNVGMWGISWGGFNALQVATHKPKALKAIISICSTDDRFRDDIHYHNGCLLNENIGWSGTMQSYSAYAPDPLLVGDDWRDMWLNRLQNMPLHAKTWMEHSFQDEYWKQGSINQDYNAIEAAVYLVGGWWDAYHTPLMRMIEHLKAPKKALVGPWAHKYPHFATPDPAIGFLKEALRWWDYWLKGKDTGIMNEPAVTLYMQDAMPPAASYNERPGHWVQEKSWPSSNIAPLRYYLTPNQLTKDSNDLAIDSTSTINSPETVGAASGEYCVIWLGPEYPTDQRRDDAFSTVFTSQPLTEDMHILGAPTFSFDIISDKPVAKLALRLNDVFPNGESARITYSVQNLCMREGFDNPQYLEPGKPYRITIKLDDIGYIVPAGHRISLSISDSYWPLIWPSPEPTCLTLKLADAFLDIPCHNNSTALESSPFGLPESAKPIAMEVLREGNSTRQTVEDAYTGSVTTEIFDDFGTLRYSAHGLTVDQVASEKYIILPNDPTSAQVETKWVHTVSREKWNYKVESTQKLHSDKSYFYLEAEQIAWEDDIEVHRKVWSEKIDRKFQ
ncbi:peptidase S15 [Photobacterium sanctipauli]|uniref:Peptidase S15 n=1 Tax=Photobacterium sanctipauli TaxID=1342794 RepID=A0A2T3NN96_9GAMM|nr:CocE/NonD family hydrolase [Photobacterium sanctipauli]PSW16933.1 peptidase S15 [Photobacterium sanctipauli]